MYTKFSYVFRLLAVAILLRFASLNSKRCIGVWVRVRVDLTGKINRVKNRECKMGNWEIKSISIYLKLDKKRLARLFL